MEEKFWTYEGLVIITDKHKIAIPHWALTLVFLIVNGVMAALLFD
jgi:hypothetical protein